MFFDWLDIEQTFDVDVPLIGDFGAARVDLETGVISEHVRCFPEIVEGSYSTKITIFVNGCNLRVRGNPSRYGREENLFGYQTLDECVAVYNGILRQQGLPQFTKNTELRRAFSPGTEKMIAVGNGATIKEVHATTNIAVGEGNEAAYLKALASQQLGRSYGNLYSNGQTVDWLTNDRNAPLVYSSAYNKAYEMTRHVLRKAELQGMPLGYLRRVINYCEKMGVVRLESKIKGRKLSRENMRHYGCVSERALYDVHQVLLNLDKKLKIEKLDMTTVAQKLLDEGVVTNTKAANTTMYYFTLWMNGECFDLRKSQVKIHRGRLRKIGIDIGRPCDIAKFSPLSIKRAKEIKVTELQPPYWYRLPKVA